MEKYTKAAVIIALICIVSFAIYVYGFAQGIIPPKPDYMTLPWYVVPIILVVLLVILGYYSLMRKETAS